MTVIASRESSTRKRGAARRGRAARVFAAGTVAVLAVVLAACGSDDAADSSSDTSAATAPGTDAPTSEVPATEAPTTEAATTDVPATEAPTTDAAETATTRTVETIHGPVEIPTAPTRVVALNFVDTANLLDLGVTPVGGTTAGVSFLPEYADAIAAMPDVINVDGSVNLELVASLEPDLIIGSDWLDASQQYMPYDELATIAPTALFEWQQAAGNWPDQAAHFADAVGKSSELEALKSDYEAQAEEISTTYADLLASQQWALVQGGQGEWYYYTPNSSHGRVLADAGVQFAPIQTAEEGGFVTMSSEQVAELAPADVIAINANESAADGLVLLEGEPLWPTLPAVQNEQVFPLQWFFPTSYKVSMALLDELTATLDTMNGG